MTSEFPLHQSVASDPGRCCTLSVSPPTARRRETTSCPRRKPAARLAIALMTVAMTSIALPTTASPNVRPCAADDFVPQIEPVGAPFIGYNDPEPLRNTDLVVYQTNAGRMWLGNLDPETGTFASGLGLDLLIAEGVEPITASRNGPEWGVSSRGTSIYYVRRDQSDVMQLWRARVGPRGVRNRQLTFGSEDARGIRPSVLPLEDDVLLFFGVGNGPRFRQVFAHEADADNQQIVDGYYFPSGGGRFIAEPETGRAQLLYTETVSEDPLETQIALRDVESGEVRVITNDAGAKIEPRQFRAPEYGGELLILSLIDRDRVAIYRDLDDGSGYWTRIEELTLPEGQSQRFLYSIKPLGGPTGDDGIDGVSYFSLVANADNDKVTDDSAMWILGLGNEGERLCRRVDPGAVTGDPAFRYEPEPYLGSSEVFLIYNVAGDGSEPRLSRALTGIELGPP
jgi:hypothetical protein